MSDKLADDLIIGTANIAKETGQTRRQAQYSIEKGEIPAFKLGGKWASLRSILRQHFAEKARVACK